MMYRLIFLTGSLKNQRITVEPEPMVIGRDPDCAISVSDDEMARKHAVLEHRPEGLYIRDLDSMNRILVNKREVREVRLKHGDSVEIGRTRFLVQALVQAEVDRGQEAGTSRRQWRVVGFAVIVVLAAVVATNWWVQHRDEIMPPVPGAEPPAEIVFESEESVEEPVPAAPVAPPAAPVVSEDLRLVREDLAAIKETMKALTDRVQPAENGTESEVPSVATGPDRKTAEMFEEAQQAIGAKNAVRADQLLAGLQVAAPDFIPAYEERARLFERRGLPEQAIQIWGELVDRNPSPEVFERAVRERLRLSQEVKGGGRSYIRIASADQHKVLTAGDYDEMRILKVVLEPVSEDLLLDPESARVEVIFYDEDPEASGVQQTRATVPQRVFQPDSPWKSPEPKTITASYVVPKGTRGRAQFYGYVVRVFYGDRVQDVQARPKTLLRNPPRARPSGGATS